MMSTLNRILRVSSRSIVNLKLPQTSYLIVKKYCSSISGNTKTFNIKSNGSQELDFENHKAAFASKTFWEVGRNLVILQLCGISSFAQNSLKLANVSKKILGKTMFEKLMRLTAYGQFVAGNSDKEIEITIRNLKKCGIRTILTIPNEEDIDDEISEQKYDACLDKTLHYINLIKVYEEELPKVQLKVTSVVPAQLLLKLGKISASSVIPVIKSMVNCMKGQPFETSHDLFKVFTPEELKLLENGVKRLKKVGERAAADGVVVLVDAEYTYINKGISIFCLAMMGAFNQQKSVVWNTYQCYLKKAINNITEDLNIVTDVFGACFGAKIVRGAYLERERELAAQERYPDPTNENYEATSAMYQCVLDFMLEYINKHKGKCGIIVASHNEESVRHSIKKIHQFGLSTEDGSVCFGQLLGMCDQITFSLGQNGYTAYKSMPFGAIDDVLPYLYRRAMENRAVLKGSRKEVMLLKAEMKYRLARSLQLS